MKYFLTLFFYTISMTAKSQIYSLSSADSNIVVKYAADFLDFSVYNNNSSNKLKYNDSIVDNPEKCPSFADISTECNLWRLPIFTSIYKMNDSLYGFHGFVEDRPLRIQHLWIYNSKTNSMQKRICFFTSRATTKLKYILFYNRVILPDDENDVGNHIVFILNDGYYSKEEIDCSLAKEIEITIDKEANVINDCLFVIPFN